MGYCKRNEKLKLYTHGVFCASTIKKNSYTEMKKILKELSNYLRGINISYSEFGIFNNNKMSKYFRG